MNDVALQPIPKTFRYRPLLSAVLLIVLAWMVFAARDGRIESEASTPGAGQQPVQAVEASIAS